MKQCKIEAGASFPDIMVYSIDGKKVNIGNSTRQANWQIVLVYRGKHCPLCTKYLNQLESYQERLTNIGVKLTAVSADSLSQLQAHLNNLEISYPVYYGLTIEQMQVLGLYISNPKSAKETDHPFSEPGLFVINSDNQVQVVDISNNPFVRPDLESLVSGIAFIKDPDNHYPIRGTYK